MGISWDRNILLHGKLLSVFGRKTYHYGNLLVWEFLGWKSIAMATCYQSLGGKLVTMATCWYGNLLGWKHCYGNLWSVVGRKTYHYGNLLLRKHIGLATCWHLVGIWQLAGNLQPFGGHLLMAESIHLYFTAICWYGKYFLVGTLIWQPVCHGNLLLRESVNMGTCSHWNMLVWKHTDKDIL